MTQFEITDQMTDKGANTQYSLVVTCMIKALSQCSAGDSRVVAVIYKSLTISNALYYGK